jgi:hypothetical protein
MSFVDRIIERFRKLTGQTVTTTTKTTTLEPLNGGRKMKVSLSVGINRYPNPANNLAGCVNDANDFATLLKEQYGFDEVRMLLNSDATLQNVTDNISELLDKKPDVFVMTNSSHGTRIPSSTESDGYCEALCLYDKFLMDHDFHQILSRADPKTHITIVSDSCHSAGLTRAFLKAMNDQSYISVPKYLPSPDNMEAMRVSMMPIERAIFEPKEEMNEVLIAGCKSDQYSFDAVFDNNGINKPNGAFTYYAIQVLKENPNISYDDFIVKINKYLPCSRYPQCPVCETNSNMKNTIIFS